MCTVSYVATNGKTIITSNRDEKIIRPSAIEPKKHLINNKIIVFPQDPKGGGTWFAVDELGTILVLLNGAKKKHTENLPYRKSRGMIVLNLISSLSPKVFWKEIDLDNIEPFTLVLFQEKELFQLSWNGIEKESIAFDIKKNHVWSSVTLYSKKIRKNRADWFHSFMDTKSTLSESEILHFHRHTEKENIKNGLVINRNNELKTLSITQTAIETNKVEIKYFDLIANKDFETTFITK